MEIIDKFPNYSVSECGTKVMNNTTGRYVKIGNQVIKKKITGHLYATLCNEAYEWKRVAVARLVAMTYIFNPDNLPHVRHRDGDLSNNSKGNLYWASHSECIQDSYDNGRVTPTGADSWNYGKVATDHTKSLMSESHKGELHPKFKGWYAYGDGRYASAAIAEVSTGVNARSILRWSKENKNGWAFILKHNMASKQEKVGVPDSTDNVIEWDLTKK